MSAVVGFVALAVLAMVVVYGVTLFNNLVRLRHEVQRAWANIDVLLKQQHDELPKLVDTCKQHMQYEQETLDAVIDARARVFAAMQAGDVAQVGAAEGALRSGLGRLFAVAEQYPDLKASDGFRHLQGRISSLEETLADRREFYNHAATAYNVRQGQLPDVLIARAAGHQPLALLEFPAARADVDVGALFGA